MVPRDRGDGHAVRIVADHQPLLGQYGFEVAKDDAGLDPGSEALGVDVEDAVHALDVQHQSAVSRNDRSHDAGATAVWDDRNAVLVGPTQDVGHFSSATRPHHHVGQALESVGGTEGPGGRQGVTGVAVEGVGVGDDVIRPDDSGQRW